MHGPRRQPVGSSVERRRDVLLTGRGAAITRDTSARGPRRDDGDEQSSENHSGGPDTRVPLTTISHRGMILSSRRRHLRIRPYGSLREYFRMHVRTHPWKVRFRVSSSVGHFFSRKGYSNLLFPFVLLILRCYISTNRRVQVNRVFLGYQTEDRWLWEVWSDKYHRVRLGRLHFLRSTSRLS